MIPTILSKLSGNEDVKVLRFPSFRTLICHRFRASTQMASALRFIFLPPILKIGSVSLRGLSFFISKSIPVSGQTGQL